MNDSVRIMDFRQPLNLATARACLLFLMWVLVWQSRMLAIDTPEGMPASASTLKVMSYNIHHGEGTDQHLDLERIARIIRESGADIVALQELDQLTRRTGGVSQTEVLASELGMHHQFARAIHFQGGAYGLAVLSRWPILRHQIHALPYRLGQEPRIALETWIEPGEGHPKLHVVNVHLCHLSDETRQEQVQRVLQLVDHAGATPTLLAGDFNANPGSLPMAKLWEKGWQDDLAPHAGIDYVLRAPDSKLKRLAAIILKEPIASDHLPVMVTYDWPEID
jgi:endonuclease/exonuclease/phosphatase family metal-dependent hydrolase